MLDTQPPVEAHPVVIVVRIRIYNSTNQTETIYKVRIADSKLL